MGATDIGKMRSHNEDAYGYFPELGLYLVVDGLGGGNAGETPARRVVDSVREFFTETQRDPGKPWPSNVGRGSAVPLKMDRKRTYEENRLTAALRFANQRHYALALTDRALQGTGATLAAVSIVDEWIHLAHVGECRIYRRRGEQLERLTEDHSLLNELKPEDAAEFPHSNIILRAIGVSEELEVDTRVLEMKAGDDYLLCTDGLWGMLEDPEIGAALHESGTSERAVGALIERANANGGHDNIAVVLLRIPR